MGKFSLSSQKTNDAAIEHTVKCTICGEILTCSTENTAPLVDHLRKNHPDVQVARFPELQSCVKNEGNKDIKHGKQDKDTTKQSTQLNDKDYLATGDHKKEKKFKKLYETTVEVWKCSQGPMLCENCGVCQVPIVRVRKKSLSESTAAAICLLGCWPICFLPYMVSGGNSENVTDFYCSKCGHVIKPKKSKAT